MIGCHLAAQGDKDSAPNTPPITPRSPPDRNWITGSKMDYRAHIYPLYDPISTLYYTKGPRMLNQGLDNAADNASTLYYTLSTKDYAAIPFKYLDIILSRFFIFNNHPFNYTIIPFHLALSRSHYNYTGLP